MSIKATLFIPARFSSSRFPGKPLALINGKPMIWHVYSRASKAKNIKNSFIVTDDERIKKAVEDFGAEVIMTSKEASSGTDRIAEAASILGLEEDEIIVNVQGDQPLVHPESIDEVIHPFYQNDGSFEMTTLIYKIINDYEITNPKDVKVVFDINMFALYFSRATIPYGRDYWDHDSYKHLGIYAYTKRFIDTFNSLPLGNLEDIEKLEQLRALEYGYKIKLAISRHDSPEVDLPSDIEIMESHLNKESHE
jgi:3-deoxy-manno-octulosonate cytidylyltransferase (CMP-KDO synthetase)